MEEKEFDPEVEQEEQTNEEDVDTSDVQNEVDYKAEALKWKAIAERNRKKSQKLPTKQDKVIDEEIIQKVNNLDMLEKKRQFGYENNLSPEETDFVFKFASNKPDKTILENPFVKSGLEGFRATKKLEQNIPSPSSGSSIFGGKSFSELSEDDRKKAFEERTKNFNS